MIKTENTDNQWFEEMNAEGTLGLRFKITEHLYSKKSPFQQVDVYNTLSHGRLLAHDSLVMVTEKDEHVYHDMITHVPLFVHPNPVNVLIIGGGDGGTAREVLKHPSVRACTMVEIDPIVIEASREFLPQTSCEFNNPKLTLITEDGVSFVKNCKQKFDVVIVDSSDPIGPATPLFNTDFYKDINALLSDNGIVVSQCESPYYHRDMQETLLKILNEHFPKVHLYTYTNLSYPGGYWAFSFASKGLCPIADIQKEKFKSASFKTTYYNPNIHMGAFMLPTFMAENYKTLLTPLPELVVVQK